MLESAALLLLAHLTAPQAPASPNVVRICSIVEGTCSSIAADSLDPTRRSNAASGQLAFVDPATGALVAPTLEQEEELARALSLAEESKRDAEPVFETLSDGTVRARGDFRVFLRAATEPGASPTADEGETP